MLASEWIIVIGFGAVLGLLGQGLRVVVGMKKRIERAAQKGEAIEPFEPGKFYMSLFTGALAGAVAAISLRADLMGAVAEQTVLALIASGYAGSDFIEGFMQKHLARLAPAAAAAAPGAASGDGGGADDVSDKAPVDRPGAPSNAQG